MAIFNPAVAPTADPNYTGISKPISQPQSDSSMEYLLKGAGDVLASGVKTADFLVKDKINRDLYAKIDATRDAYTEDLSAVSAGKAPNTIPSVTPTEDGSLEFSSQSRRGEGATPLPSPIVNLDTSVSNLHGAYQGGKISHTYYISRLNSIAKDMRSQYPGYREYIDEKISSITGMNPANAVVNSLLRDINAASTGADKDYTRAMAALDTLNKEGVPFANLKMDELRKSKDFAAAEAWVNEQRMRKHELANREAERKEFKGSVEERAYKDRQDAIYIGSDTVTNYLKNVRIGAGFNTIEDVQQRLLKHETGQEVMSSEEAVQLQGLVQAYGTKARNELLARFRARRGPDQTSIEASLGGPGETAKFIDESLFPINWVARKLGEKDIPAALWGSKVQEAVYQDGMTGREGILKDASMRKILQLGDATKNMAPAFHQKLMEKWLVDGMMDPFKTFIQKNTLELINQPDARKVKTANDVVTEAKVKGVPLASVYSGVIRQAEMIYDRSLGTDPGTDKAKIGLARGFFDPKNLPMLTKFEQDSIDEAGNVRPGQHSIAKLLSSPVMTPEIKRLSKVAGGEGLWEQYENTSVQWFKHLFGKDVRDISKLSLPEGVTVDWSTEDNQWRVMHKNQNLLQRNYAQDGTGIRTGQTQSQSFVLGTGEEMQMKATLDTFKRINSGLQNVAAIAKEGDKDVGAFLLNTLGESGFSPEGRGVLIPHNMVQSIKNSRLRKALEDQANKGAE